ncbi:hypothetical protein [Flavobacterium koreense]
MNKKVIISLLVALSVVFLYSYFNIPNKFETEGGSCYQGITASIIRFFLKVCCVLNVISIIFLSKIKSAKFASILALTIWSIGTLIHSSDNILIGFTYFTPFLLLNIVIVIIIFKMPYKLDLDNTSK